MNKSKIFLLLLTPALLCGCTSKCTFQEYKDKVDSIDVEAIPSTTKVELSCNDGKNKDSVTLDGTINDAISNLLENTYRDYYRIALSTIAQTFRMGWGSGDPNFTYFMGSSGTKIVDKRDNLETTYEFNKYGHCTRYIEKTSDSKIEVRVKYTYAV